jgi:hypothetical protein
MPSDVDQLFGMFGDMINNNPNLSSLNKIVGSTNSDLLKGVLIGAGLSMLLSSDFVKEMLQGVLGGINSEEKDMEDSNA